MPTKELAMLSISMQETPKSQSLISPWLLTSMFEGFTSSEEIIDFWVKFLSENQTSVQNVELLLQVGQPVDDRHGDPAHPLLLDATHSLQHNVQRQAVHELHANGNVVVGGECAIEA